MKVIAYYALHYGREYLKWSLRSVLPFVDAIHIFYTEYPSFGYYTEEKCHEARENIMSTIGEFLELDCVHWHDYGRKYSNEGMHRDYCLNYVTNLGADIVLPVDADEVYAPDVIEQLLKVAGNGGARYCRVNMMHFWRTFEFVCYDEACPVRAVNVNVCGDSDAYVDSKWKCWHFGYAQTPKTVNYKSKIHGHLSEWRQGWFENKFLSWKVGVNDVHPTNVDFWNPVPFDYTSDKEFGLLMSDHPYYALSNYLISDIMNVLWWNCQ